MSDGDFSGGFYGGGNVGRVMGSLIVLLGVGLGIYCLTIGEVGLGLMLLGPAVVLVLLLIFRDRIRSWSLRKQAARTSSSNLGPGEVVPSPSADLQAAVRRRSD